MKDLDSLPIPEPKGIDKAFATLQSALLSLSWMGKVYARAWERKVSVREMVSRTASDNYNSGTRTRIARQPFAYAGNGEYIPMLPMPVDNIKSYAFFLATGEEKYETKGRRGVPFLTKRNAACIVWLNLKELGYEYIATEDLKGEVIKLFQKEGCINTIDSAIDEHSDRIFEGFDLDEVKQELLAYPFAGFRINFTLKFMQEC